MLLYDLPSNEKVIGKNGGLRKTQTQKSNGLERGLWLQNLINYYLIVYCLSRILTIPIETT